MPVQRTHRPACCALGHSSALSQPRLLSALAMLRDALAPSVALSVPPVLDRPALLAYLSLFTTDLSASTVTRPSRHNFAGFCQWCGRHGCIDTACIHAWARTVWMICPACGGNGVDPVSSILCGCYGGLTEADVRES